MALLDSPPDARSGASEEVVAAIEQQLSRIPLESKVPRPPTAPEAEPGKLPHHCDFGAMLNDMLRDRLVCGCGDQRFQYKLLSDPKLTFTKTQEVAKADKTAAHGTKDLFGPPRLNQLNGERGRGRKPTVKQPPHQTPTQPCSHCGAAHSPAVCTFKDSTCHYCHKKGHLASVCRSEAQDEKGRTQPRENRTRNYQLQAESSDDDVTPYSVTPNPLNYATHTKSISCKK